MEAGLAKSGRDRSELQIVGTPYIVTGETEEEFEQVKLAAQNQIAFYASTPAYSGVLDSIGYADLQPELTRLSKAGRWEEMGRLIDDKLLSKIALVGDADQLATQLSQRYGDIFDVCPATVFTGEGYSSGRFSKAIADVVSNA